MNIGNGRVSEVRAFPVPKFVHNEWCSNQYTVIFINTQYQIVRRIVETRSLVVVCHVSAAYVNQFHNNGILRCYLSLMLAMFSALTFRSML